MRWLVYSGILMIGLSVISCRQDTTTENTVKTLDSLETAINGMMLQMRKTDTALVEKSVSRFHYYRQFIKQNINDTITKTEADHLRHFYDSGTQLENFSLNRKNIIARASLAKTQIAQLTVDAKNGSLSAENMRMAEQREYSEISRVLEEGYEQIRICHSALQEFRYSLSAVELLLRSRNNGELPRIIKDTLSI